MKIYQSNTYRKHLSYLPFNYEPRVQEKQQVKDQHSSTTSFVAYLSIQSRNQEHQPKHDHSTTCMVVSKNYRDIEQPQETETS